MPPRRHAASVPFDVRMLPSGAGHLVGDNRREYNQSVRERCGAPPGVEAQQAHRCRRDIEFSGDAQVYRVDTSHRPSVCCVESTSSSGHERTADES